MRSRPAPKATTGRIPEATLARDPQVIKWAKRLAGDPEALPRDLDEDRLRYVYRTVLAQRGPEFDLSAFERAMESTAPVVAAPEIDDVVGDLGLILAQPEMEQFWSDWDGERGRRGPGANYPAVKALMATIAMTGISAHVDDCCGELDRSRALRALFTRTEHAGRQLRGERGTFRLKLLSYTRALELMPRLAPGCIEKGMAANIAMVRTLREMLPDAGIGERLMIDGTDAPAWVKQVAARRNGDGEIDSQHEALIRCHTPEAGFRAYVRKQNGKRPIGPDDRLGPAMRVSSSKAWRGYYLVVIADQATGLPLVWDMVDAAEDEAPAIVGLLSTLYRLWPDCPATMIAGDSAWDEEWACRLCEVDYGIHPVFRLHDDRGGKLIDEDDSESIMAIRHNGQMVCRKHQKALPYETAHCPSRGGLRPGQTKRPEGAFRVRSLCEHDQPGVPPCGKPGLRMQLDWRRLTYFPHFAEGNPERHAMREAMLARLAGMEGLFNRLKAGRKLATNGADRTRIRDKQVCAALVTLALMSMTAATLADQRRQLGVSTGSGSAEAAAA
jgi:hypothetical protein